MDDNHTVDERIEQARAEVDGAMADARRKAAIGSRLARALRESREDNNFRAMLRRLGVGGQT